MPSSPENLLWWPVLVQTALFGLFASAMLARAAWIPARARALGARLDRARDELFAYLTTPAAAGDEVLRTLGVLPKSQQLTLLGGLSRQLGGPEKARLERLAASLGLVDVAVAACSSRRWWERLQGVRTLLLVGVPASIPLHLVRDSHPLVRAEAVRRWSNTPLEGMPHLLALLHDTAPVGRFAVQDALLKIGSPAARALGEYLVSGNPAGLTAAIQVATRLADSAHLRPALDLSRAPSDEVRAATAALLGSLGGPEAKERLVVLLSDVAPQVREAALASLAAIGEWSVAPIVANSLEDQEWSVRRRAALTLAQLGSAGKLYLLKAAETESPAGVMSRYALSLPPSALKGR